MINERNRRKLIRAFIRNDIDYLSKILRKLKTGDLNFRILEIDINSLKISEERKIIIKDYFKGYIEAISLLQKEDMEG